MMIDPLIFYKSLAQDTRLKLILLLTRYKELCVCDFTDALALDQPKISRHLAELRGAKIMLDERRGKWIYYRLHPSLPEWAKEILKITLEENKNHIETEIKKINQQASNC